MRIALLLATMLVTVMLTFAGCGCDPGTTFDAGITPACPAGVEGSSSATPISCGGADTTCISQPSGFVCNCVCGKYWECDQVLPVCDKDGGT